MLYAGRESICSEVQALLYHPVVPFEFQGWDFAEDANPGPQSDAFWEMLLEIKDIHYNIAVIPATCTRDPDTHKGALISIHLPNGHKAICFIPSSLEEKEITMFPSGVGGLCDPVVAGVANRIIIIKWRHEVVPCNTEDDDIDSNVEQEEEQNNGTVVATGSFSDAVVLVGGGGGGGDGGDGGVPGCGTLCTGVVGMADL